MSSLLSQFRPDRFVGKLEDIDLEELWRAGKRAILLDLDNTIAAWGSHEVPAEKADWIARARERFGVCLVTNTIRGRRAKAISERFGIRFVARWLVGRKPSPLGILQALSELGCTREQGVMVGDQLLTDIWAGRRAGVQTILVHPISPIEFPMTKISRAIERCLFWMLRRKKMIA